MYCNHHQQAVANDDFLKVTVVNDDEKMAISAIIGVVSAVTASLYSAVVIDLPFEYSSGARHSHLNFPRSCSQTWLYLEYAV